MDDFFKYDQRRRTYIYKRDNLSSLKTVKFSGAYCLNYIEDFNSEDGQPLKTRVVISSKEISVNDTTFVNLWPDKI
jgi:hypothetical protein